MQPKYIKRFIVAGGIILLSLTAKTQIISLPKDSKFKIGDNMAWKETSFDDASWETKKLGTGWGTKDGKENVYAWYRIRVFISDSIKAAAEFGKGVKINLGKIDDVDFTYLNGKLVGQSGSLPPAYVTQWDVKRTYIIPPSEILWNQENIIAVRVFSPDPGGVGMYEGPYQVAPVQWTDHFSVLQEITGTPNNGFITKLHFTCKNNYALNATATYRVTDMLGKELFTETKNIQAPPISGAVSETVFNNYQPGREDIVQVGYTIMENESRVSVSNEKIYLANRNIQLKAGAEPVVRVQNKIKDRFTSHRFQNQIQQGYLGNRLNRNITERLLKIDEPGIIDGYLQRPGNHPWVGEHVGKYLEAACNAWKNSGDDRLKKQMDRIVYELIHTQLADGYLGTYTPDEYWTSWDVWSHKYNLYGLLAYYTTTGYEPALTACRKIGDLLCATFGNKPGQRNILDAGTHIGMAATSVLDPMVELYKYTGEKKYLDFCYYITRAWEQADGPKIISTLLSVQKTNKVGNGKAYEMLSNFTGMVKLYQVTGDKRFFTPALIAWKDIVARRLYITGTASAGEYFHEDDYLPAAEKDHIGEGCVTTTWMQFNHVLFTITGEMKYLEQIEKSVYNHLLGAENPQTGCVSYYTPLMDKKPFGCGISCCVSSVPRGIAMIPCFTFGMTNEIPAVLMYEPAIYNNISVTAAGNNINLSLNVQTRFPENGKVTITVSTSRPAEFPVALRIPSWCSAFTATVGSEVYRFEHTVQTGIIRRKWKTGDKIKISFQLPVRVIPGGKSYPNQVAFQRGPQVLAFDETINGSAEIPDNQFTGLPKAANANDILPAGWIGQQVYTLTPNNKLNGKQLILVPFADASQAGGDVKVWLPAEQVANTEKMKNKQQK